LLFAFCFSARPDVCGGILGEAKSKQQKEKSKKGASVMSVAFQQLLFAFCFSKRGGIG